MEENLKVEAGTRLDGELPRMRREEIPDHARQDDVGVVPGVFAKEPRGAPGRADEGTQDPGHLNADKRIEDTPEAKEPAMPTVTGQKRTVVASQHPLAAQSRDAEQEGIEQNRGFIMVGRGV